MDRPPSVNVWLLVVFLVFGAMGVCTQAFAQEDSLIGIGTATVDHDRAVAPRWVRLDFAVPTTGRYAVSVSHEGSADILFSVFDAGTGERLAASLTAPWIGELTAEVAYYLGIWSVSGVGTFTASYEPLDGGDGGAVPNSVLVAEGSLDSELVVAPRFRRIRFTALATAEHTLSVAWDGDADVRFNVFDANGARLNAVVVIGSNPGLWSGDLEGGQSYELAVWSFDGAANFNVNLMTAGVQQPPVEEPPVEEPPVETLAIATQPADSLVVEGDDAVFFVVADSEASLSYQWLVDGVAVDGATSREFLVPDVTLADDGTQVAVEISDGTDTIVSDTATLTVVERAAPISSVSIVQTTLDSERAAGPRFMSVEFQALADASHRLVVAWDGSADVRFNVFDGAGAQLNTVTVAGSNPGEWVGELVTGETYSLSVWAFDGGTADVRVSLEATVPLGITRSPSDIVVAEGRQAQFSVDAVGSGTLAYQWFADGVALPGEQSASLTLAAVAADASGSTYTVSVDNGAGSRVTSEPATLTVVQPVTAPIYSTEPDLTTWVLNGPAPTLDFNASNPAVGWGRVLLRVGDVLLVGGDFTGIRPAVDDPVTERPWLAAIDAISGEPTTSFQVPVEIDSVVRALTLAPDGQRILVGGDFGFFVLDALTGELLHQLDIVEGTEAGRVFDIAVAADLVYIGGQFSHIDGRFHHNVARLSLDGALDTSWAPDVMGGFRSGREAPVQAVATSPSGDILYLGGNFAGIYGTPVERSSRDRNISFLSVSTGTDATVRPERFLPDIDENKNVKVRDIAVTDEYVVVAWGGPNVLTFHSPDGTRLFQYDATGDVQSLLVVGNELFVGHHGEFFGSIDDPVPAESVVSVAPEVVLPFKLHRFRLDEPGFPLVQAFLIRGFFGVWGISVADDALWVSGQITAAGSFDFPFDGLLRYQAQ